VLVDHLDLGQHRHEVGVPVPSRHGVKVHVVWDASAGGAAAVGSDVEPFGLQLLTQDDDRSLQGAHEIGGLVVVEVLDLALVGGGSDHDVSGVVRELVQHHERPLRPPNDELGIRVVWILEDAAEQTPWPLLTRDVLHAPRRPQSLH